jgi:hypothetical protein
VVLDGIERLLDCYEGFLVDQLEVLHDGIGLLPGGRDGGAGSATLAGTVGGPRAMRSEGAVVRARPIP